MNKKQFEASLEEISNAKPKSNKLIRVFSDTHLGNSHSGLAMIAKLKNIDIAKLSLGEYVVFVNRKQNAVKMFAPGNIIAHMKLPDSMKIDMRIIALLPKYFNGGQIRYSDALKEHIKKELPNLFRGNI